MQRWEWSPGLALTAMSVLLVCCVGGFVLLRRNSSPGPGRLRGQPVAAFILRTTEGLRVTPELMRGRKYFLLFSRLDCPHCWGAILQVDRVLRTIQRTDLLGWVVSDGSMESMRSFRTELGLAIPFATINVPWSEFGARRVPAILFVDRSGRVENVWRGDEVRDWAVALLSPPLLGPVSKSPSCQACSAP